MRFTGLFFLFFILICAACDRKAENNTNPFQEDSLRDPLEIKDRPIVVIHRAKLASSASSTPQSLKAGKPVSYPANVNVIKVGELTTIEAESNLPKITPGTDTFAVPKKVEVSPKTVRCRQPRPVPASAPRFKDAAISDIQYLDVDQGLSSSFIRSTFTDNDGNLWFGSNGGGVSRYDGKAFLHFTEKNGLSNNKVLAIYQDSKGIIWFGTEGGGVCAYNGTNFLWLTEEEGLGNNTVLAICEGKDGSLWFGTNGGGVSVYDGKTLTNYTEKEGLSNSSIRSIIQDKNGNIWMGTTGSGVCMFDGKSFYTLGEEEGLNSSIIHAILQDKNGVFYFATEDGGVNIYDGKTVKYITAKRGLSSNCIVSLKKDKWGTLWIGTYDSGLCRYDGNEISVFNTDHGLTNNYVLSITDDNAGALWLGTLGGGVCRFNHGSFTHYTEKEGMGKNTVRAIAEDKNGHLWFGTFGDGAIHYDGRSFKHLTEKEGLPSNRIKACVTDQKGNVWFGLEEDGAVRYNGTSLDFFRTAQGLNSNYILSMCVDKNGNIWFGTDEGGVCYYDGSNFISIVDEDGLSTGIIYSIIEDREGNIWFGTDGYGACCFDGKFLKWYTTRTGLSGNVIKFISEDKNGNIWFGTEGKGISKLKASSIHSKVPSFEYFTEKEGLSNNSIRSIAQDNTGNIWIATERGLNFLVPENKNVIHTYTSADGLKANNFFNSTFIDGNNTIWWGNGKALTNLNLNNYKLPESKPLIQLTHLELEQSFIDYNYLHDTLQKGGKIQVGAEEKHDLSGVRFSGAKPYYNYPNNLSLPYHVNHLDFYFSAIDWTAANKILYQYMLVGSENDWSPLSNNNKASFNNLRHGDYIFKVRAQGVSGQWSDTFEYAFTIRPPWYLTVWAYALYVIAFFGIVVGFNNIRTRQLKARQQELEQTVAERTAEVVEQKELIEEKQKEIVDSINYAKRIQSAMLASDQLFARNLKQYFVLFRPKDIVSGDFYWASPLEDGKFVLVTADSTGHGVPGAMMSMLNISCLNEAVNERKYTSPAAILNHARQRIISSLAEDGSEEGGKDGMDCSVVVFDLKNKKMSTAAANNPVWIVRNAHTGQAQIIEIKPDRMPVGKHAHDNVPFNEQTIQLQEGDLVYTLTDGYSDQFGGPKQKKYTNRRLKELLLSIALKDQKAQKASLEQSFDNWRDTNEQVDDVLIIGVSV
jgi:ligand-binding sensor domain-containing protein/serine phosphatase RsbU (regulator of sigma subunit)